MIFGMGGGKALDTAKGAADQTGLPVFTFPTIAATCAATTALSVVYKEDGNFDRFYFFDKPARHCFINTRVIADAPWRYLRAGMGDTMGKYTKRIQKRMLVSFCIYSFLFVALFARIGDALPFYGVNCVTLGTLMIASRISDSSKFFSFFGYCVGAGVSFTAALLLLWSVRQRLALTRVPKAFRGLPITLLSLGIISLALFGLLGNQLPA